VKSLVPDSSLGLLDIKPRSTIGYRPPEEELGSKDWYRAWRLLTIALRLNAYIPGAGTVDYWGILIWTVLLPTSNALLAVAHCNKGTNTMNHEKHVLISFNKLGHINIYLPISRKTRP
jgi:hypothetical protein